MRKLSTLAVAALIAAATAVVASVAIAGPLGPGATLPDGNTQSMGSQIKPKKLSKTTYTAGSLEVTTLVTNPNRTGGVPVPAERAVVDFDKNSKIFTKGIPTCDPAKLQNTSTEVALQLCGKAKIGGGTASALLPVGPTIYTVNQVVTAFNGIPQGGKPVVILHTYGTSPIQTTLVLVGPVTNINKEGYGPRIDLVIPKIAGGTGALTGFNVTINKKYKYKGKPATFISAKCPNSKKLKSRGAFTFADGETATAKYTQTCKQAK
jgi:hypothetical protein